MLALQVGCSETLEWACHGTGWRDSRLHSASWTTWAVTAGYGVGAPSNSTTRQSRGTWHYHRQCYQEPTQLAHGLPLQGTRAAARRRVRHLKGGSQTSTHVHAHTRTFTPHLRLPCTRTYTHAASFSPFPQHTRLNDNVCVLSSARCNVRQRPGGFELQLGSVSPEMYTQVATNARTKRTLTDAHPDIHRLSKIGPPPLSSPPSSFLIPRLSPFPSFLSLAPPSFVPSLPRTCAGTPPALAPLPKRSPDQWEGCSQWRAAS